MRLKRVTGTLRDFGSTWDIWSETFINYTMVMVDIFGLTFPSLCRVLLLFHSKVRKLSKIYERQNAVLPLVIDFHTEITPTNHTDVDTLDTPPSLDRPILFSTQYLTHAVKETSSLHHSQRTRPATKKMTGDICRNFNTKGCTYKECVRENKYTVCKSTEHGEQTCTKKLQ